jgi:undecaprenyl-diphosphatase
MNEKLKIKYKIAFLIFFCSASVGLEFLYRDKLFDSSLQWIEEWQQNWGSIEGFFDVVTQLGTLPAFLPIYIILYLWFPITKSYSFILNFTYSSFIMNLLKMLYSNPRPYWVKPSLMLSCSPGFGNPSGHAFDSIAVYLSLWHMITDHSFFIKYWPFKYILLLLKLGLVIAIVLSRVYLGVHSVNQIIYGLTLGFCVYYLVYCILEVHKIEPKEFFRYFTNTKYIIYAMIKYGLFLTIFIVVYAFRKSDTYKYDNIIDSYCPNLQEANRYNNDGFTKGLVYSILIGIHFGLILLSKMSGKNYPRKEAEINIWNKMTLLKNIYKILICLVFATPLIAYLKVSSSSSVVVYSLCKVSLPLLIALFNIYGPAILLMIRWKIAYQGIYEETQVKVINLNNFTNVKHKLKDASQIA